MRRALVLSLLVLAFAFDAVCANDRSWPQRIGYDTGMSVTVADLDAAGSDEIIGCSLDGFVRVWDHTGMLLPGWPYIAPGSGRINATPACVDLDGDGDLEIILAVPTAGVQAWHHDGSSVDGWPQTFGGSQGPFASVSVGNLDQDGDLEIVGSVNSPLALYIWNADGTVLSGWPRTFPAGWSAMATTALADVDDDGVHEIAFVRWHSEYPQRSMVHLLDASGGDLPGWPIELPGRSFSSPTVGDIDRDGELEIVATVGLWIYVTDLAGGIESGWPFEFYAPATAGSPPLGQIDADETLETAQVAGSDSFYLLNHDGTLLPGWPVDVSHLQLITDTLLPSPLFADLDGDGANDVLICALSGSSLWAFDQHGVPLPGWPFVLPGEEPFGVNRCTPVVADPDRDGLVEVLCAGGDCFLYVWELDAPYVERSDAWCSIHYDLRNTRCMDPSGGQSIEDAIARRGGLLPALRMEASPNPCRGRLALRLEVPGARTNGISVAVFGSDGTLLATPFQSGDARIVRNLVWDGRDNRGNLLESGVYLIRAQSGLLRQSTRVVLLR